MKGIMGMLGIKQEELDATLKVFVGAQETMARIESKIDLILANSAPDLSKINSVDLFKDAQILLPEKGDEDGN